MNFGQTCHAGTRIYVHEEIYDKFLDAYTDRMRRVTVGNQFKAGIDQGPQNSKMQYDKISDTSIPARPKAPPCTWAAMQSTQAVDTTSSRRSSRTSRPT